MLTERQEVILNFVRDYQLAQGVPPSTREVARKFGCSQPTALKHLGALARKEQLGKLADGKWGLEAKAIQGHLFEAPIFGAIPAGKAAMQEQEPEGTVAIDPSVFGIRKGRPGSFWLLRVTGDSMEGANILNGDLVAMVRRDPKPGDIIAALVDETTTTLKRYVRERGRTLLRAENPRYADLQPRRLECQGVMVGLIRRQSA